MTNGKKACLFILAFVVVFAVGLCSGFFISQSGNSEELNRAKKLVSEATITSLELAKRLEDSTRIINELRHDYQQLKRENQTIRDAIASGLDRAAEIDDITERCLAIIGVIEKLLDITGVN